MTSQYSVATSNHPSSGLGRLDGPVTTQAIFSASARTSFNVAVPAYSVVVVAFPKG